jgi:hypothetical protein
MRGQLDEPTVNMISAKFRDITETQYLILMMSPDSISTNFPPESNVPLTAACLNEINTLLAEARYALGEFYFHLIWYREKCPNKPNEQAAVFFGRFYAIDVASRLYAAGEQLAEAIIYMLEIPDARIAPYRQNRTSLQSIVARFMLTEMPGHAITTAIKELGTLDEWSKTMNYRGKWVHEQPPTVAGLGPVFKKEKRWKKIEEAGMVRYELSVGDGDEPEYRVDELANFLEPALSKFTDTLEFVTAFYRNILEAVGITYDLKATTGIAASG